MTIRKVLKYPHPNLKKCAEDVVVFDKKLQQLTEDMFETMYEYEGIGLAATQIDVHRKIIVIDVGKEYREPQVFINPLITEFDKTTTQGYVEGCLSIPGYNEEVIRPNIIELQWADLKGNIHNQQFNELAAICIQHECDHLIGKLFVDKISALKRNRIKKKIIKLRKENANA